MVPTIYEDRKWVAMSLKPHPPRLMPEELARLGAVLLPADSPYRLIGDHLYAQYRDEDFADLYHREGKPGLSPILLVLVTVFQCLENLSDRKAADAVRLRIDGCLSGRSIRCGRSAC
jgi:hypothetical protein